MQFISLNYIICNQHNIPETCANLLRSEADNNKLYEKLILHSKNVNKSTVPDWNVKYKKIKVGMSDFHSIKRLIAIVITLSGVYCIFKNIVY